jgi:mRNA-degrading endonuclease YafQ of YafQ-DinJ toxin-antitoxin module
MLKIAKSHTTPYFEKRFQNLPKNIQKIATNKIFLFEDNPYHPSLNTHKLKGELAGYWSFYVTRDQYRVLFRFIFYSEVVYYDIGTHDIYK